MTLLFFATHHMMKVEICVKKLMSLRPIQPPRYP